MSSRLCLLTGASGFLGRQLLPQLLCAGWRVRALQHRTLLAAESLPAVPTLPEIVLADLADASLDFEQLLHGVDTVFHLAATAHRTAGADVYRADSEATLRLARAAAARGVRAFVYVSSTRAMAEPGSVCRDESWQDWPSDAYGYWKRSTEQGLLEVNFSQLSMIRPCLMYGPGVKGNLRQMLAALDRGWFPGLPEAGRRSLVAAADVAAALMLLAEQPDAHRRVFIAADNQPLSARALAETMAQALGRFPPQPTVPAALLRAAASLGDLVSLLWAGCPLNSALVSRLLEPAEFSSVALREIGWEPKHSLADVMPAMLEAYRRGC